MRLLIIIPAHNEAGSIERVIGELREKTPGYDFVIINDGSSDNTAEICRRCGAALIDLPVNLGLTGAWQTGIRYAFERGYDAAVQIDGDGQHDPIYLAEMVRVMEEKNADLVVASRFVTERRPVSLRMAGNIIIDLAIRLTTGKRLTDPTSGMRLYGKRILEELAYGLNSSPEPDTVSWLIRSGARVEQVQVTMRNRQEGQSYLNFGKAARYMISMCMNILCIQWVRKRSDAVCRGD